MKTDNGETSRADGAEAEARAGDEDEPTSVAANGGEAVAGEPDAKPKKGPKGEEEASSGESQNAGEKQGSPEGSTTNK